MCPASIKRGNCRHASGLSNEGSKPGDAFLSESSFLLGPQKRFQLGGRKSDGVSCGSARAGSALA